MWIMTNKAFVSLVAKAPAGPDQLLARARVRAHLADLFPDAKIIESDGTDYRFRAVVSRDEVAEVLSAAARGVDYRNFKDSVKDRPYHDALMRVWSAMAALQPFGAYGHRARRTLPRQRGMFADERADAPAPRPRAR
jgi:hypothetical protein